LIEKFVPEYIYSIAVSVKVEGKDLVLKWQREASKSSNEVNKHLNDIKGTPTALLTDITTK